MKEDLDKIFPYEYIGGGYFRERGVPKNIKAKMIHGDAVPKYILKQIKEK